MFSYNRRRGFYPQSIPKPPKKLYLSRFKWISSVLEKYGRYSLIVLCFHLVELNCFPWDEILNLLNVSETVSRILILYIMKVVWSVFAIIIVVHIPLLASIYGVKKQVNICA